MDFVVDWSKYSLFDAGILCRALLSLTLLLLLNEFTINDALVLLFHAEYEDDLDELGRDLDFILDELLRFCLFFLELLIDCGL